MLSEKVKKQKNHLVLKLVKVQFSKSMNLAHKLDIKAGLALKEKWNALVCCDIFYQNQHFDTLWLRR